LNVENDTISKKKKAKYKYDIIKSEDGENMDEPICASRDE